MRQNVSAKLFLDENNILAMMPCCRPREASVVSKQKMAASPRIQAQRDSPHQVAPHSTFRHAAIEPVTEPPKLYATATDPAFYKRFVFKALCVSNTRHVLYLEGKLFKRKSLKLQLRDQVYETPVCYCDLHESENEKISFSSSLIVYSILCKYVNMLLKNVCMIFLWPYYA